MYQIPIDNTEVYDAGDPVNFSYVNNFPSYTPSVRHFLSFINTNRANTRLTSCSSKEMSTSLAQASSSYCDLYHPLKKKIYKYSVLVFLSNLDVFVLKACVVEDDFPELAKEAGFVFLVVVFHELVSAQVDGVQGLHVPQKRLEGFQASLINQIV